MTLPRRDEEFRRVGAAARGCMRLDFAVDGAGRSYLRRQYAAYPFHVCRVHYPDSADPGLATLYAQSCSGGIYENDDLTLELIARQGASVHFTTQASTIVHSMAEASARHSVAIVAEEHSYLEFLPDPQILFAGSAFISLANLRVAETATVVMSDAFLLPQLPSRTGMPRRYCSTIAVTDDHGHRLAADRLTLAGGDFTERRPGVLGVYNAHATLLLVTRDAAAAIVRARVRETGIFPPQTAVGITELPNAAGYMCRVLAEDGVGLKRATTTLWRIIRQAFRGYAPEARRK